MSAMTHPSPASSPIDDRAVKRVKLSPSKSPSPTTDGDTLPTSDGSIPATPVPSTPIPDPADDKYDERDILNDPKILRYKNRALWLQNEQLQHTVKYLQQQLVERDNELEAKNGMMVKVFGYWQTLQSDLQTLLRRISDVDSSDDNGNAAVESDATHTLRQLILGSNLQKSLLGQQHATDNDITQEDEMNVELDENLSERHVQQVFTDRSRQIKQLMSGVLDVVERQVSDETTNSVNDTLNRLRSTLTDAQQQQLRLQQQLTELQTKYVNSESNVKHLSEALYDKTVATNHALRKADRLQHDITNQMVDVNKLTDSGGNTAGVNNVKHENGVSDHSMKVESSSSETETINKEELTKLQVELAEWRQRATTRSARVGELEDQLKTAQLELQKLANQLPSQSVVQRTQLYLKVKLENASLQQQLVDQRLEIDRLQREHAQAVSRSNKETEKFEQWAKDLQQYHSQQIEKLQQQHNVTRQQSHQLTVELEDAKAKLNGSGMYKKEIYDQRSKLMTDLETTVSLQQRELDKLRNEVNWWSETMQHTDMQHERDIAKLRHTCYQFVHTQREILRRKQGELEHKLRSYQTIPRDATRLADTLANLKGEVDAVRTELQSLKRERDDIKTFISGTPESKQQLSQLRKQLEMAESVNETFSAEVDALAHDFEKQEKANVGLLKKEKAFSDHINTLQMLFTHEKMSLQGHKHQCDALELKVKQLTDTHKVQQDSITAIRHEVTQKDEYSKKLLAEIEGYKLAVMEEKQLFIKQAQTVNEQRSQAQEFYKRMTHTQEQLESALQQTHSQDSELAKLKEDLSASRQTYKVLWDKHQRMARGADRYMEAELEEYRSKLQCKTCHKNDKDTVITKCWHVACKHCIDKNIKTRHRKCGQCGLSFGEKDVHTIYLA